MVFVFRLFIYRDGEVNLIEIMYGLEIIYDCVRIFLWMFNYICFSGFNLM